MPDNPDPYGRIAQQSIPLQRGVQYAPNAEGQQALADWTNQAMAYGFKPDPFSGMNNIGNDELRFAQTMKSIMDQQMAAHGTNNIAALPGYLYNFMSGLQPLMTGGAANVVLGNSGQFDNGYQQGPLKNDLSMSPLVMAYRTALQNGGPGGPTAPAPNSPGPTAPDSSPNVNVPPSPTAPSMPQGIAPGGSDSHSPSYPGDVPAGNGLQNIIQGLMPPGASPSPVPNPTAVGGNLPGPSLPPSSIPPQMNSTPGPIPGTNPAIVGTPGPVPATQSQFPNGPGPQPNGAVSSTNMNSILQAVLGSLMQVLAPAMSGVGGLPTGPQMSMRPQDISSIIPGMQSIGR